MNKLRTAVRRWRGLGWPDTTPTHCDRKRAADGKDTLTAEERQEATARDDDARPWLTGLEAVYTHGGVKAVYDRSATPFYLKGSGYPEGTLFPWVVSDFSRVDAIEAGIVEIPRVPVADDAMAGPDGYPVYRNLWHHIRDGLPKKGRATADPAAAVPIRPARRGTRKPVRPLPPAVRVVGTRTTRGRRTAARRRCSSSPATTRPSARRCPTSSPAARPSRNGQHHFPDRHWLFPQLLGIVRRWLGDPDGDAPHVEYGDETFPGLRLFVPKPNEAAETINRAIVAASGGPQRLRAERPAIDRVGTTAGLSYDTTKAVWTR